MKTFLTAFLFAVIATCSYAAGIDGTWKTTMKSADGDMEMTFVFKMEGEKLTGTIKTGNGDMAISNAKVNGKEFSFTVEFGDSPIKHSGVLKDDDTITLKVVGSPMGDMEMKLTRKKE